MERKKKQKLVNALEILEKWQEEKLLCLVPGIYLFILIRAFFVPALIWSFFLLQFFLLFCHFKHQNVLSNLWCESHPRITTSKRLHTKQNWKQREKSQAQLTTDEWQKEWHEKNEATLLSFRQVFGLGSVKRNTKYCDEYRVTRAKSAQFQISSTPTSKRKKINNKKKTPKQIILRFKWLNAFSIPSDVVFCLDFRVSIIIKSP